MPSSNSRVSVDNLSRMLHQNERVQLLDVRETGEFLTGHIHGAANVPLEKLRQGCDSFDRALPIYVVCTNGTKADLAYEVLTEMGCSQVYVVAGGLKSWKALGFPLRQLP